MLAMVLMRQLGCGVMSVWSHAGDGVVEARCRCRVWLVMVLSSHVGNGAAEVA
jgi:hypothetical protein